MARARPPLRLEASKAPQGDPARDRSHRDMQDAIKRLERQIASLTSTVTNTGSAVSALEKKVVGVDYVATGAEGVDFFVPTGVAMTVPYDVAWAPAGCPSGVPFVDLPSALPTDRTAAQFRVLTNAQIGAGARLTFLLFQR